MSNWISVDDKLPEPGQYVYIHLTKTNWGDNPDAYFKSCRFERGISLVERKAMQGNKPFVTFNPYNHGGVVPRYQSWSSEDEGMNNERPYCWFNPPSTYFGQDVDYWMPIPKLPTK